MVPSISTCCLRNGAALALQRASDVPIEIKPWERSDIPGAGGPPLIPLEERCGFDWSASTFAFESRKTGGKYYARAER